MPGLFSICIKGTIAVFGCAVLFCGANEPGAAQYEQRTAIVANPAKKGDRLPMTSLPKHASFVLCEAVLAQASPTGRDPMFSPIADPAHASLYGRCMT